MKTNLIVETQQLGAILLVDVLVGAAQTNRVQRGIFLFYRLESDFIKYYY